MDRCQLARRLCPSIGDTRKQACKSPSRDHFRWSRESVRQIINLPRSSRNPAFFTRVFQFSINVSEREGAGQRRESLDHAERSVSPLPRPVLHMQSQSVLTTDFFRFYAEKPDSCTRKVALRSRLAAQD